MEHIPLNDNVSSSSTLADHRSSGPENDLELRGAVGADSDKSMGEETKGMPRLFEMEESAEKDLEVNRLGAANNVALQIDDLLINQTGAVGTESDTLIGEDIKEIPKLLEMEEHAREDLEVNGSGATNDVALPQSNDLLFAVSSSSTLIDNRFPGPGNEKTFDQRGAVGIDSDILTDKETKEMPKLLEREESAEKDIEVNGSGATNYIALSQRDDLPIIEIGAVGIDSDKLKGEATKEMPKLVEMEESAEKGLEVNESGAANYIALSQSDDLLINQTGTVGIDSDKSTGEELKEMPKLLDMEESVGKDLEANISVAANDFALSQIDDCIINQIGEVGIDSDKSAVEEMQETTKLLETEESVGKDLEENRSVATKDVALFQRDDLFVNQIGAVGIDFETSAGEDTKEMPELLEMEESVGQDLKVNGSGAANDVALSQSDDLFINHIGVVGIDSDRSIVEEIKEMPELLEMEDNVGKDLEENRSSTANEVALSPIDDLLINQIGAVGTESYTSIGEDNEEMPKMLEISTREDLEVNRSGAANNVVLSQSDDILISVSSSSTLIEGRSSGEDIREPKLLEMGESAGKEVGKLNAANDVALFQSDDLLITQIGAVGTDSDKSTIEEIKETPRLLEMEESVGNDLEADISVTDNDVVLSLSKDLLMAVLSSYTLHDDQSSDIKEPQLLEMEESAGQHFEVDRLTAANDVTLCQSGDHLITEIVAAGIDYDKSTVEEIKETPKLLEMEGTIGNDLEANISAADNDVALSLSDDLLIAVSSSSTLADDQSSVEIDAGKSRSEETEEMPELLATPEPEKCRKNVKFNLRKSLAWDSAFFTSDGVLNADELSTMMEGGEKNVTHQLPGIEEEVYRSMDSISTLESDNLSLECLEAELFEDIRASIQKSNRPSSNVNNSSCKVLSGKKDCQTKVSSSSEKMDLGSGKQDQIKPDSRIKGNTSSIPQPKITSRVNSSSTSRLTKSGSLTANHAKKDQDIAKQPHVIQKGTQAAMTTTQGLKMTGLRRGVPKPLLSSKSSPMGSSTALKTEPTRLSSSHSNSSSCSSGTDVKSSTTISRKKIDPKTVKLTNGSVPKIPSRIIIKNKAPPLVNARLSSSISPSSSISEWSSESSSSTSTINQRSISRGSIDTSVSYRSLDSDASVQSALSIHPTGRISNQNGNQPISKTGSLSRPPSVQPTGLRMPSPKIGFFDGGKSGVRTPNGGVQSPTRGPTSIPKTGATHCNPTISNGVKSGKIPPPKTGAAHTNMKPNPHKTDPKPSQEQPKPKRCLVTSDASDRSAPDGSRAPFAVKNSVCDTSETGI